VAMEEAGNPEGVRKMKKERLTWEEQWRRQVEGSREEKKRRKFEKGRKLWCTLVHGGA
jgi:hypothetical protein